MTETGILPIGVTVDGVTHRDFEIRGAKLLDNIEATDELLERGEPLDQLRLSSALMARQLVRLGTLPKTSITTDLMRGLDIADWNTLDSKSAVLQKKMLAGSKTPEPDGGSASAPGSSDTASAQLT